MVNFSAIHYSPKICMKSGVYWFFKLQANYARVLTGTFDSIYRRIRNKYFQIFHVFMCTTRRTSIFRHGIRSPLLVLAGAFDIMVLLLLVFTPGLRNLIGVEPPPAIVWIFPILVGIVLIVVNEVGFCLIQLPNKILKFSRRGNIWSGDGRSINLSRYCGGKQAENSREERR